jgi:hypothetical protein
MKVVDGCVPYGGTTCISLEVLPPATTNLSVDQLEVAAVDGFAFRPVNDLLSPSSPGLKTALPAVLPVLPPMTASGPSTLFVRALSGGTVLATGTTTVTLMPGGHVAAAVRLTEGLAPDADPVQSTVAVDRSSGVAADGVDAAKCTIHVVDAAGNPLAGRRISLDAVPAGAQVAVSGLSTNGGDVSATITSTTKGTYALTATVEPSGAATVVETMPTVTFVTPGKLAFTLQPKNVAVDSEMTVQVSVEDPASGAVITEASTPITLSLGSNPGTAALSGDVVAIPKDGVATFSNVNLDAPGSGFTLVASATSLTKGTSASFDVNARAWTRASVGLDGGSVNRLLYDPSDGDVAYAAVSSAGVYKTIDGGNSWHFSSYGAPDASWALAIDPVTPTNVYASSFGAAVYKSTNGGASWKQLQLPPGSLSYGVAVDPKQPSTLLVDTMSSILRSDDAGSSWTVALSDATQLTVGAGPIYAETSTALMRSVDHGRTWMPTGTGGSILTADPVQPDIVYATAGLPQKTINAGQTWTTIAMGLPSNATVHRIAISPTNQARIYAALDSGGAFVSNDGGMNWTNGALPLVSAFAAAAHPSDSAKALVCSINSGVFATADGGSSWSPASRGIPAAAQTLMMSGTTLFAATSNGLYQSLNAARSWSRVPGLENGIMVAAVAADSAGTLYAATRSEVGMSQLQRYDATSLQWSPLNAAASGIPATNILALAIDPGNANHIIAAGGDGSVYNTANGGSSSWSSQTLCNGSVTSISFVGSANTPYATCLASMSSDPSGVFTSADGGATWTSTSAGAGGIPTTIGIYSFAADRAGSVFYVGGANGTVYRSTDHVTWTSVSTGISTTRLIAGIAVDPTNNAHVWITSTKVFVTSNGGTTWSAANDGLRAYGGPLLVDPTDPNMLYVAAFDGVYKTSSGGL